MAPNRETQHMKWFDRAWYSYFLCFSRGRSKTQISLLPRALQKSTLQSTTKPSEPVSVNDKPSSGSENSDTTASNTEEKSTMSNSDFRKFLLKWKYIVCY